MRTQIKELLLPDGKSPYADWFATLDAITATRVRVAAARMEQGNLSNVEWFQGIGEYKSDWGPGYRIYLAKDGPTQSLSSRLRASRPGTELISRAPWPRTDDHSRS